jgi:hypothetical protein
MPKDAPPDAGAIFAKVLLADEAASDLWTLHEPAVPDVLGTTC